LGLQTKLTVNEPGNAYEQEADRVAEQVVAMPAHASVSTAPPHIQRRAGSSGEAMDAAPASVEGVLSSPGRPLDPALRQDMGQRFGYDFSGVRVHTGLTAEQSARDVDAKAYTVGHNIVFGPGQFSPDSHAGRRLLSHELTHVVQQRGAEAPGLSRQWASVLQREEADPDTEATTAGAIAPPEFGDRTAPEGACPRVPTNLGALRPDPPCPTADVDINGDLFHFCMDSDVFASETERSRLRGFARRQRADATFTVHGYSSREGGDTYNLNLSCHRAKRAARELQNAGVPLQQLQIAARGRTRKFGPTGSDNRVVVVGVDSLAQATVPQESDTPQQVVTTAVANLQGSGYRLAADSYVSRWTCGRIPSVAEMVRRTTILIEGDNPNAAVSRDPLQPGSPRLGHPNVPGLREIVLARETFAETSDPIACAEARIVDMAFHHFLAPTLGVGPNDPKVHPAALFLVELAGLAPCMTPAFVDPATNIVLTPAQQWWQRPTADPLASEPRPCLDQPLPGAIDPQHQPARPVQPPTFTVSDFRPESGSAPVAPVVDLAAGVVTAHAPRRAFAFDAEVTASGDPAVVANYQVGFLQTVVADGTTVEYVGGQAAHLAVPVPMRDGPPRNLDAPPWYMPPLVTQLDASGVGRTRMSDAPSTGMPYEFVMPELLRRADPVQRGNVVNRARVRTTFNTWLAARRNDAPLDRFNTHFLRGHQVQFNLDIDVVGRRATGSYSSLIDSAPLSDATPMQLSGPTPAEINPLLRTTHVSPALPRDQASGLTIDAWRQSLRDIAAELQALRQVLGLSGQLMVRVSLDPATGRLRITRPDSPTVTVEEIDGGGRVSKRARARFADALLERLRKDLVLAPVESRDPATVAFPTVLSALGSHREVRADDNPFAPEHGIGLLGAIREEQELARGDEQLRDQPDTYDPALWPRINVRMAQEAYCYDFTVSGVNISNICADQSMRTEGCVRSYPFESALRVVPSFVPQRLGRETFNSPVAMEVISFRSKFVLYTPRESPGGSTFNHEMHHLMDSFDLVQNLKDRLARRIRARLMEARRLAAQHPELKERLLSAPTIQEIAAQEELGFKEFFNREFVSRGDALHARESSEGGLPPYQIRPGWGGITPQSGRRGSFTNEPCE
jgi:outer membrane protein OmpA-like peptidoglycan-associated protein